MRRKNPTDHCLCCIAVYEVGNFRDNVVRGVLLGHPSLLKLQNCPSAIWIKSILCIIVGHPSCNTFQSTPYQGTFDFVSFLIFLISFFNWRSIFSFHCFRRSSFRFRNPVKNSFRAFSSNTTLKLVFG